MEVIQSELKGLKVQATESNTTIKTINETLQGLGLWMPKVDVSIKSLQESIAAVGARVAVLEAEQQPTEGGAARTEGAGATIPFAGATSGSPTAQAQGPANGVNNLQILLPRGGSPSGRIPKSNFPKFDGDNPGWWKAVAEKYFAMYDVPHDTWATFATMHFWGNAALWLQTYESMHEVDSWEELVVAVNCKFGKDKYHHYLDQLERIQQHGTMDEFYHAFEELMHRVLMHNKNYDEAFFVTKFLKGLRQDIQTAIRLHKPRTVDAALSLAQTQEDMLEEARQLSSAKYKHDYKPPFRTFGHQKSIMGAAPGAKLAADDKLKLEQKLEALKTMRREKGLCFKCGEKYHRGYKCTPTLQVQLMEELLCLLQHTDDTAQDSDTDHAPSDSEPEEGLMHVSQCATAGTTRRKTMLLHGIINGRKILVLIDFGSSSNFIGARVVESLQLITRPVHVAKTCQGHTFTDDLRVLNLDCYDIILGMDWLEDCRDMWVNWQKKTMCFKYQGKRITLRGIKDNVSSFAQISALELNAMISKGELAQLVQLCPVAAAGPFVDSVPAPIQALIDEFQACFQTPTELPPQRAYDHRIPLIPGTKPVAKDEIEKQVRNMLEQGIIRQSHSPFASPVLLVRKKDGTWRFCVDYRHLNAVTVKENFPMPIGDELLDEHTGAQFFTKLDLRSGYHQIRLAPKDESKTAFRTHHGHFEFTVMPFGLTSAPATFQSAMNLVFASKLRKSVLVFVDDILVYSGSLRDHCDHLRKRSLEYLGHIISGDGVSTDPAKISAVQELPIPANVKQLRGFLGLAGYYRKFIPFQSLKQALVQAPVLVLPDFSKQFVLETDASDGGAGAVLMQDNHPLAFMSKALDVKNRAMSTYDKECLAILMAIDKWKSYLQAGEFLIYTHQKNLCQLGDHKANTPMQQKAFFKLLGFQYRIVYKKGTENSAADALSRRAHPAELSSLSNVQPRWLEIIIEGYHKDAPAQQLLTEMALQGTNDHGFSLHQGVIRQHGKIWLGSNKDAHRAILLAFHSSAIGGHSGVLATYQRVKDLFIWPGLKQDVASFVQQCKERAAMQQLIQQHLERAQHRMKRQADKKRSDRTFNVGDWVFLRLQPYIQQSVAQRSSQKLSFRFFGPYQIIKRVGKVSYKL
ncbi:uncharacterized protein LOC106866060 [Brachypodium distachyon]|uniref:uncharacterized protein LOC106866060 n=1 Tax=Brachypodium distachyon TaxID=15368 RepID=UPI00071E29B7|nr:uncharacterized protein LOC106866060 [Brachypodium distachyon]|eukprot:XP_014754072.1 uncharacterized protein LOC106866060 [Brachypodium distachyon]